MRPKNLKKKSVVNKLDMAQITALVKLKSNVDKKEKEEENDGCLKEGKEIKRKFKAFTDDGRSKLHEARFLALPSKHPRHWYKRVPMKRKPFIKNRALDYTGIQNAVTNYAVKRVHDRTKAVQLKHFYSGNLNVSSKQTEVRKVTGDKVETTFDLAWSDPASIGQVQEALLNYACLLQSVWPSEATALIMMKVLTKYKWLANVDDSKRASLVCKLFEDVSRQNAGRATNKEAPLSADEQEEVLKSILLRNNIRPEVPIEDNTKSQTRNQGRQGGYGSGSANRQSFKQASARKTFPTAKSKDGKGVCYGFNDMNGGSCRNTREGNGCKTAAGVQLAHVCNHFDKTKQVYCLGAHPRKQHK